MRASPQQRRKAENRSRSITTIIIIITTITAITALFHGLTGIVIITTIIITTIITITVASGFTFVRNATGCVASV